MGARASQTKKVSEGPNDAIEKDLLRQRLEALFNFKFLLLGAGESGKSTIVKQFRLINNKKPDQRELDSIAVSLNTNVIDCFKSLISAAHKFSYELDAEDNKTAEEIHTFEENDRIKPEQATAMLKLWRSEAIRQTYNRRSEFWILDACEYYMDNLERFTEPNFVPVEEDIVRARVRTTGIVVTNLEQKNSDPKPDEPDVIRFQVVDVGGQRNERKKWIHCFDDVKAILFIVNLNAYDQVLFEDGNKNRMVESLELFKEITNNPTFRDTPIILFLNKKDLFESLIHERDLTEVRDHLGNLIFSDYTGKKNNVLDALSYLTNRFKAELPPDKEVDIQIVTGVVKKDIKDAFNDVKRTLIDFNKKAMDREKLQIQKDTQIVINPSCCLTCCAGACRGCVGCSGCQCTRPGGCCPSKLDFCCRCAPACCH